MHTPMYLNIGAGHGRYIPLSTSPSVGAIFLEHHLDEQKTRGSQWSWWMVPSTKTNIDDQILQLMLRKV